MAPVELLCTVQSYKHHTGMSPGGGGWRGATPLLVAHVTPVDQESV